MSVGDEEINCGTSKSIANSYNSLPRRSKGFQCNTLARRSKCIMENNVEYFVPRSVSDTNLSGVEDLVLPPPAIRRLQVSHIETTAMNPILKIGEETGKCPHGIPTTPRKIINNTFI